jgi:hypothetical protein
MQIDTAGTSFSVGSPGWLDWFNAANMRFASGADPVPSDWDMMFVLAMPAKPDSIGEWYAYRLYATSGELLEYMRVKMLKDIGQFYGVDLPVGVGSGMYDCDFGLLANLWHAVKTGETFTPGVRSLDPLEMSYLLRDSTTFQQAVRAVWDEQYGVGVYDTWDINGRKPTPLLMEGYGTITMPDLSGCVSTGLTLPGGNEVPPGEVLPENKEPPPAGVDPVKDLGEPKVKETSWWPWVAGGAALLGVGWLFTRKA